MKNLNILHVFCIDFCFYFVCINKKFFFFFFFFFFFLTLILILSNTHENKEREQNILKTCLLMIPLIDA